MMIQHMRRRSCPDCGALLSTNKGMRCRPCSDDRRERERSQRRFAAPFSRTTAEPVVALPVPLHPALVERAAEVRRLRRDGWSFGSLARRYEVSPSEVAAFLGERFQGRVA